MADRSNSQQCLLRLTGCCFALALTSLFPLPASALVSFSGIFADDGSGGDTAEDDLTLTNDLSSTEDIFTVVFDLTTAATGTTFEPATWSFVADAGDAAATGFTGEVVTATTLTLTFTDFNAGESLSFTTTHLAVYRRSQMVELAVVLPFAGIREENPHNNGGKAATSEAAKGERLP